MSTSNGLLVLALATLLADCGDAVDERTPIEIAAACEFCGARGSEHVAFVEPRPGVVGPRACPRSFGPLPAAGHLRVVPKVQETGSRHSSWTYFVVAAEPLAHAQLLPTAAVFQPDSRLDVGSSDCVWLLCVELDTQLQGTTPVGRLTCTLTNTGGSERLSNSVSGELPAGGEPLLELWQEREVAAATETTLLSIADNRVDLVVGPCANLDARRSRVRWLRDAEAAAHGGQPAILWRE